MIPPSSTLAPFSRVSIARARVHTRQRPLRRQRDAQDASELTAPDSAATSSLALRRKPRFPYRLRNCRAPVGQNDKMTAESTVACRASKAVGSTFGTFEILPAYTAFVS
jgi:hypothetical protein